MGRQTVVAVCTNRGPSAIMPSLTALAQQAPGDRILLVMSGLPASLYEAYRASAPGHVIESPHPGLSRARNTALEWAAQRRAGAIAFVDDDAIVEQGWWDALEARWGAAGDDVGAIGGRIRPRWERTPPGWISDPILPTLTLLDLGDSELELDPRLTTVYGANISFAVEPLRLVGGFDPAYGHSGSKVFFSEEDQAQRALAERGYRVLYAPELSVEHVIPATRMTRRSFVRRRFAYGRALGRRGGRGGGRAARQLATSGAGALVALARRDGRLLMERAVRAAENAGVLAGRARRG